MSTSNLENPFRAALHGEPMPDPCAIVIFGATGDLARRKLFPSFMNLFREHRLNENTVLIGISRRAEDLNTFRRSTLDAVAKFAPDALGDSTFQQSFADRLFLCAEDLSNTAPFRALPQILNHLTGHRGTGGNILFYLSVPPSSYESIIRSIAVSGLATPQPGTWIRIIVEKPFGRDFSSAVHLNNILAEIFHEEQIFRIDHYMGKETVQNIQVLRMANTFLEPIWNNRYVDHVQISVAESVGVEDRAAYYEEAGALRDMIQNHLLQLLATIAMELPARLEPEAVRNEKIKVLQAVRSISPEEVSHTVVRAQYTAGAVGGKAVKGYREEPGVSPGSHTETFCALRLWIDNWRWRGVPFYLRTGKRLPKRIAEVAVQFKPVPHLVFHDSPEDLIEPNSLIIRIQPNEGITLKLTAKLPGHELHLRPVDMDFRYGSAFAGRISDAYEHLLHDAILGDPTLFARRDAVEEGWKITMPILDAWLSDQTLNMPSYAAGSWGPVEADALLASDGRRWRML